MAKLNVFLADLPGKVTWPSPIRSKLQSYFDRVIAAVGGFEGAQVQWTHKVPILGASDLLVYFVLHRSDSVVKKLGKSPRSFDDGFTKPSLMGTGTEVYYSSKQSDTLAIANLTLHEFMHNITGLGDALHNKPNLSLGKESIAPNADLSAGDIEALRPKLKGTHKQWTGGFDYYHDPLR
jgi:hypothetical protein